MNRLYLIRHGENLANLTLEFSHHQVDYSLTPKGQLQAAQTGAFFKGKRVDEIYASPLKRAMETAQPIADVSGVPVIPVEAFREVNVGEFEGQKPTAQLWARHNAIIAHWMNGHPETTFPGGEDYPTLLNRVHSGLTSILRGKQNHNIVIVAHGGLFAFTLRDLCAGVDQEILDRGIANCSIITLDAQLVGDRLDARLIDYPSIDHLSGEALNLVSGLMSNVEALEK